MRPADSMHKHLRALYVFDDNDRIVSCNQFSGGPVPRFHLARTTEGNLWAFRHDVGGEVIEKIERLAQQEPPLDKPDSPPAFEQEYSEIFCQTEAIEAVWHGPAYRFPLAMAPHANEVVDITEANKECLRTYMDDWLIDVGHRAPFVAMIENGQAVAVCASSRISLAAHEAGVETAPQFRHKGYAARAATAWAHAVAAQGAVPLYSTSWDNLASQALAKKLSLVFIGSDYHIR